MRRIDLETGDINTNERVTFRLVKGETISMGNDAKEASFPADQWSLLLDQVRDAFHPGSPEKTGWGRFFDGMFDRNYRTKNLRTYPLPPLGSEPMKALSRDAVTSTPKYQLFLACLDLARHFLFEQVDDKYKARCLVSVGKVYSGHGNTGVFLVDDKWLGSEDETRELVHTNRLCKVTFDQTTVRYYFPYVTPFRPELSAGASKAFDRMRDYYHIYRVPAV